MPYVFITLENEFGPVNVILRPQVYAKYHKVGSEVGWEGEDNA